MIELLLDASNWRTWSGWTKNGRTTI